MKAKCKKITFQTCLFNSKGKPPVISLQFPYFTGNIRFSRCTTQLLKTVFCNIPVLFAKKVHTAIKKRGFAFTSQITEISDI